MKATARMSIPQTNNLPVAIRHLLNGILVAELPPVAIV